jgi:hypothetical protein
LLNNAYVFDVSVVGVILVDILALYKDIELIYLAIECFGYFLSQVSDCLEVTHWDHFSVLKVCLMDHVDLQRLNVAKV